jgi:hypothetical protein
MDIFVATTRDEANADRVVEILKKAGSTHAHKTRENGAFTIKFTEPSAIESYLRHRGEHGRKALNKILQNSPLNSPRRILGLLFDNSPDGIALRSKVIAIARKHLADFPR